MRKDIKFRFDNINSFMATLGSIREAIILRKQGRLNKIVIETNLNNYWYPILMAEVCFKNNNSFGCW